MFTTLLERRVESQRTRILIQVQEPLEKEEKSRNMRNSWRNLVRELDIKEHELKSKLKVAMLEYCALGSSKVGLDFGI